MKTFTFKGVRYDTELFLKAQTLCTLIVLESDVSIDPENPPFEHPDVVLPVVVYHEGRYVLMARKPGQVLLETYRLANKHRLKGAVYSATPLDYSPPTPPARKPYTRPDYNRTNPRYR